MNFSFYSFINCILIISNLIPMINGKYLSLLGLIKIGLILYLDDNIRNILVQIKNAIIDIVIINIRLIIWFGFCGTIYYLLNFIQNENSNNKICYLL